MHRNRNGDEEMHRADKWEEVSSNGQMAYLAHEIRTSLNSICGNLDILRRQKEYPDSPYLENAASAAEYLMQLVSSELYILAMGGSGSAGKVESVTLEELLRYSQSVFEQEAAKKQIQLRFFAEKPIYQYLYINRGPVCQIMMNLVSNAIKYTENGGSVTCRITETYLEEKRIRLSIEVADTGVGMEEEFLSRVWQDYEREHRKEDAPGSGLGLALTKRLVELLSGRIEMISRVGCGTKVLVELEADADDVRYDFVRPKEPFIPFPEEISKCPFKRALLAEDEESNMTILGEYLHELGIAADKTYDGKEVIEIFEQSEENYYDVILMDINIPGINGIEAIQMIRNMNRKDRGLPIIVMTADIDIVNKHKRNALSVEVNACLMKPYRMADIQYALSVCQER